MKPGDHGAKPGEKGADRRKKKQLPI